MRFNVKSISKEGVTTEAIMEAENSTVLAHQVQQQGGVLISAEVDDGSGTSRLKSLMENFGTISTRDKINFARNLGAMIEAGLDVSRAITVMERQSRHKKLKNILSDINSNISAGKTLSDSMALHAKMFSPLFISMVKAGEESGSLAQSLKVVGGQLESSYMLTKKVKGALMYPSIIVFAMGVIGFFMLTYVVPTLTATFRELNVELPKSTQFIIWISDMLKNHTVISIVTIFAAALGIYLSSKTKSGKRAIDFTILHFPLIGNIAIQVNAARTARTMSSLLSSGVDMVVATQITHDVLQNSYYKDVLLEAEQIIQKGEPLHELFSRNEKLYPPFVNEMMAVGEETGQLAKMLMGVATFYEGEVEQKTKDMSTIIEPFLMVVIGAAVGFFAISMVSPIYSIGTNI